MKNKFVCPVCLVPAKNNTGLSSHVRGRHKEHWLQFGSAAAPEAASIPEPRPNGSPAKKHLDDAIGLLEGQLASTRAEIATLSTKQSEEVTLVRQIEALRAAQLSFDNAL